MSQDMERKAFAVQAFKAEGPVLVGQPAQWCDSEREARNLAARLFKAFPGVAAWGQAEPGGGRAMLLKIGRVPEGAELALSQAVAPDLAEELLDAAERIGALPQAELQRLLRRAAAAIRRS